MLWCNDDFLTAGQLLAGRIEGNQVVDTGDQRADIYLCLLAAGLLIHYPAQSINQAESYELLRASNADLQQVLSRLRKNGQ